MEYYAEFDRAFPVAQTPLGLIAGQDWDALRQTLRTLGFGDVDDLPELTSEDFTESHPELPRVGSRRREFRNPG